MHCPKEFVRRGIKKVVWGIGRELKGVTNNCPADWGDLCYREMKEYVG